MMKIKHLSIVLFLLFAFNIQAQVLGCTDPLSSNYNPAATINDGSCIYAATSVTPVSSVALPATVVETSGLIKWGEYLYTNNDNTDTNLYALDTDGAVMQTLSIAGVTNIDWEEIAQDDQYIYIGDFGNNNGGNRTNLKIYKVEKASLIAGNPVITIINFSYSNQVSYTATGGNNTDFDCEAFIVSDNNIYLFTKQWVSKKTSVYSLPKTAGTYTANLESSYNVNGLITGATYLADKKLVALCGYSSALQPFFYLLYDFEGNNFFGGNKRKLNIPLAFNQTEGITTENGLDYYVTNEKLVQSFLNIPQKLHTFDLRPYLEGYIASLEENIWNGNEWTLGTPASDEPAVISGDYNSAVHGEITAASLTVNSGNVTIASGTDFVITGAVNVAEGATFTIENNANLIQIDDVENSGSVNAEKNSSPLYALDYTLWSSPVKGTQTLKDFSPSTLDNRFYIYNTDADSYDNYQSASGILNNPSLAVFTPGKGYLIRMPYGLEPTATTVFEGTFKGAPNNGIITIPLGTGGNRFNAVGNPYPSPINIHDFINTNEANLENGTLYFWRKTNDPNATSYVTVNKLAYIANSAAGGDTSNGNFDGDASQWIVNPGQGFYVKASASAGSLVFNNSMRRADNNSQFFRMDSTGEAPARLWLNIENTSGGFAQTAIGYTAVGTAGIDYGYDGQLLDEASIAIYTIADNAKLCIQARPQFTAEDVVQLGYNAGTAGIYTISLAKMDGLFDNGQDIFIRDKVLNITHNFAQGGYTFTTDAGNINSRFEIVYTNASLATDQNQIDTDLIIYKQDNRIYIDASITNINQVSVYDLSGRNIYSRTDINAPQTVISDLRANNQVVIVQITLADKTVINKKVIN